MHEPSQTTPETRRRVLRAVGQLALFVALLPVALWCALAIALAGDSGSPELVRGLLAGACAVVVLAAPMALGPLRGVGFSLLVAACVVIGFATLRPSNARNWWEPQSRTPHVRVDGARVTIADVRDFRYREGSGAEIAWDAAWREQTLDLDRIVRAWFVLTEFGDVPGVGHVMVSFEFEGPEYLVVPAEIRREDGEIFDPLRGLFRQFEIMYVIADERDAVALRTNFHRERTWLVPVDAGRAATRAFLVDMLERANALNAHAEWYNTLTNSCSSNLAAHYERINDRRFGIDRRIVLPGYSLELLAELGLLPDGVSLEQARALYLVNERAQAGPIDATFSTRIREGMPLP